MLNIITKTDQETQKAGELLAEEINELPINSKNRALLISLSGDLGGGKTTFAQGFAKGLGIQQKITSPSFVILKKFNIPRSRAGFKNFYHLDCYRIQDSKEILELGFSEMILDKNNLILVEWAEKIKEIFPTDSIWVNFKYLSLQERKIIVK